MTKKAQALLEQALKLSPAERLDLARQLEESVEQAEPLSAEWAAEIDRRLDGLLSGKVKPIPAEEALASIRRELKARRSSRAKKRSR